MKKSRFRNFRLSILFIALGMVQMSCSKETDPEPDPDPIEYNVQGLWVGSYTVTGLPDNPAEQLFTFALNPDGTLVNETKGGGQQHLSIGTWTLVGTALKCTTTCVYGLPSNIGIQQAHTAVFDKNTGTLSNGEWKYLDPKSGSGTFSLTKVQ